ncbi:hypothetical protein [Companilactobacillus halodurans]|uniref:Uncharacterized protein n=1 Tax=Companilactobacillus halodurans TaxID=2584183 RepID=A0A5P0ZVL4_9LACO|nr:hypothetical protein [Companilactobacillus halodurans]MQS75786.1 hypothetical protein [Companilactobacillus halodurans]MQS96945.1 hypothetical protein [Companilactobacillus halodurans]
MESIEFGQKINYVPMAISWGIGLIIGLGIAFFTHLVLLAVILGVTFLVISGLVFARTLSDFYGYWEVDNNGIKSFDYQNFAVRFQSILMPFSEDQFIFKFSDIKALTVVVGKDMNAPANVLGGSFNAPKKIIFNLPTPYYLRVQLKDSREVNLDLSVDWEDSEAIQYVIAMICDKANIGADIVKQA